MMEKVRERTGKVLMALGFMGAIITGCALDGPRWLLILGLVMANLVMMMVGQRLLDTASDDGFINSDDIEEIEESIEAYDLIEQEYKIKSRRSNCFEIWSQEVRNAL